MSAARGSPKSPSRGDMIVKRHDEAFFTFGRFQPPTLGHRVLAEKLATVAGSHGDPYIFVSSSRTDPARNPLDVYTKVSWMKYMFRDIPVQIINTTVHECTTVPQIVNKLREAGYDKITMIVGSDRAGEFDFLEGVTILQAGEARDDDAAGPTGMSGTKMRKAARNGETATFMEGTGLNASSAARLMHQIVEGTNTPAMKRSKKTLKKKRRT
jgi:hypothetical protein